MEREKDHQPSRMYLSIRCVYLRARAILLLSIYTKTYMMKCAGLDEEGNVGIRGGDA